MTAPATPPATGGGGLPNSLTEEVGRVVRAGIRSHRFVPGQTYSVQQIAELVGVSRSPAREALVKLAEIGLVVFVRNRGFRVVLPRPRDIAEIFAIRAAIEPQAAGRLAGGASEGELADLHERMRALDALHLDGREHEFWQVDRELHGFIVRAAGNARAADIVTSLREITSLLGEPTSAGFRSFAEIESEHQAIVDRIAARDVSGAEQAMRRHLTNTGRLLVAQVAELTPESAEVSALWESLWADVAGPERTP